MPQAPTTSGVINVRDMVPQLNYMSENSAKAARDAVNLGLDIQNEIVKNKQKDVMSSREDLIKSIEADKALLAQLKAKAAEFQKNATTQPLMGTASQQSYIDNVLNKTAENDNFWNFRPAPIGGTFNG